MFQAIKEFFRELNAPEKPKATIESRRIDDTHGQFIITRAGKQTVVDTICFSSEQVKRIEEIRKELSNSQ